MTGCEPWRPVSPEEFVATHEFTRRLKELGLTDRQLEAVRFTGLNTGWPFDQWSFTWDHGTPLQSLGHLKAFAALKWLILDNPSECRDKNDAWQLVNHSLAAPMYQAGLNHKEAQRLRACKPRGRVGEDGRNMEQIVHTLANRPEHRDETARELWPHLFAELEELGVSPSEIDHIDFRKRCYTYEFKNRQKKITVGQFANLVSRARKRQKSG
jgi:hypothetical protein